LQFGSDEYAHLQCAASSYHRSAQAVFCVACIRKAHALHGLQSRKSVSMIKEHHVTALIFTGRDFSLGVTERAKRELCF
jgi:hypothetical protein